MTTPTAPGTWPTSARAPIPAIPVPFLPWSADRDGGHLPQWNSVAGKTYAVHAAADLAMAFLPWPPAFPPTRRFNCWTNAAPGQTVFHQIRVEP